MAQNYISDPFYYRVFGQYALFTDPVSKGGGEKFTYQIPTYQALKGITEQIYWKPTLLYYIDEVRILNRIETETKGMRVPFGDGKNDLSYYTYLRDVSYAVKFHFEWNLNRPELMKDREATKHREILLRSIDRGGRRDLFLGTRECVGYIERLRADVYESLDSYYANDTLSFGLMFHSFTYPDESYTTDSEDHLVANFSNSVMEKGRVRFCRPEACDMHRTLRTYRFKKFSEDQLTYAADEKIDE